MTDVLRWNWPLCAAGPWAGVCLVVAVPAYLYPGTHTLFPIYDIASRQWWAGEDMYTRQAETTEIYRYSPAFAVLASPFATLPPGVGNTAWKLTNAGIFAIGLWVWCRRGLPDRLTRDQVAAVFLLALPVAGGCVYNGQANLLMTGLLLLGLDGGRGGPVVASRRIPRRSHAHQGVPARLGIRPLRPVLACLPAAVPGRPARRAGVPVRRSGRNTPSTRPPAGWVT